MKKVILMIIVLLLLFVAYKIYLNRETYRLSYWTSCENGNFTSGMNIPDGGSTYYSWSGKQVGSGGGFVAVMPSEPREGYRNCEKVEGIYAKYLFLKSSLWN